MAPPVQTTMEMSVLMECVRYSVFIQIIQLGECYVRQLLTTHTYKASAFCT